MDGMGYPFMNGNNKQVAPTELAPHQCPEICKQAASATLERKQEYRSGKKIT
jgi:hypothetical protein